MAKTELQAEGGAEKFANMLKKRKPVYFEIAKEEGLGEYASETIKMFDDEGAQVGKMTYAEKGDAIHVTHFHIDLWEEKQDYPQRFVKWFEGYAKKKKAKDLRIEVFERDAKTYDLVTILRAAGFSPTATGFMKGRTSYELHKKL
jgi:predicted GNAT family acetyltransferase